MLLESKPVWDWLYWLEWALWFSCSSIGGLTGPKINEWNTQLHPNSIYVSVFGFMCVCGIAQVHLYPQTFYIWLYVVHGFSIFKIPPCKTEPVHHRLHRSLGRLHLTTGNLEAALHNFAHDVCVLISALAINGFSTWSFFYCWITLFIHVTLLQLQFCQSVLKVCISSLRGGWNKTPFISVVSLRALQMSRSPSFFLLPFGEAHWLLKVVKSTVL